MNSAFTHIDLCMSAIIISMNFLYCADGETRTLTLLLAPDSNSGVSTISPHPHKRFVWAVLFFPRVQSAKLFLEYHLGATQMILLLSKLPHLDLPSPYRGLVVEKTGLEPVIS